MLSRQHKLFVLKIVSLFSVVRGYNIPIIALAQYLSAIFYIGSREESFVNTAGFSTFYNCIGIQFNNCFRIHYQ